MKLFQNVYLYESRGSLRLGQVGLSTRSLGQILEKSCVHSKGHNFDPVFIKQSPSCVAQSVGHLTRKSGVLGSIPSLATYFHLCFRFFKKGSCQLLGPNMTLDVYRGRKTTIQQQHKTVRI